ncbi:hypothetical protein HDZ31DRAFT_66341 [Schizophyllum fasciatum]
MSTFRSFEISLPVAMPQGATLRFYTMNARTNLVVLPLASSSDLTEGNLDDKVFCEVVVPTGNYPPSPEEENKENDIPSDGEDDNYGPRNADDTSEQESSTADENAPAPYSRVRTFSEISGSGSDTPAPCDAHIARIPLDMPSYLKRARVLKRQIPRENPLQTLYRTAPGDTVGPADDSHGAAESRESSVVRSEGSASPTPRGSWDAESVSAPLMREGGPERKRARRVQNFFTEVPPGDYDLPGTMGPNGFVADTSRVFDRVVKQPDPVKQPKGKEKAFGSNVEDTSPSRASGSMLAPSPSLRGRLSRKPKMVFGAFDSDP